MDDPELVDALRDPELIRIAHMLGSAATPEPPIDDAFRSALRRQLMDEAWKAAEGRNAWWRRLLTPQGMAWTGAAATVVIVASVVIYATQSPGVPSTVTVNVPVKDSNAVALQQPIQVKFNQPMNRPSAQAAVQITPSTTVTFSWSSDSTVMYVQPASGNLAPNTEYVVTVGPGAQTQSGTTATTAPKSFTFVTQPTVNPSPTPPASPSPSPLAATPIANDYPGTGTTYPVVWSADSSTIYYVGGGGALEYVAAQGGSGKTLVPDGVSLPAMAPAGDRIAYVRGGKIEILTVAAGTTSEVVPAAAPTALRWVHDRLYWGTVAGVFRLDDGGPSQLADVTGASGTVVSIAPDGRHALVQAGDGLTLVDLASGKTSTLCVTGCAAAFAGWSPDGTRLMQQGGIYDLAGRLVSSIPAGDWNWSAGNEILIGSDTGVYEVRPDGTGLTKLADGTYHLPVWAPDSKTFAFVRGAALYVGTAPAAAPAPVDAEAADDVVGAFMHARLDSHPDKAGAYLDDAGKAAYSNPAGPALIPSSDLGFKRFFILTTEADPSAANRMVVVVRLVFAPGEQKRETIEETITLMRQEATDPMLIDGVTATQLRSLGKGPEVVAIKVTATSVQVTFDSDLVQATVGGISLQDATGATVQGTATYANRVLTVSGLQLTPGAQYRLVVLPSVQDVGNRHVAAEYDLGLVGQAPAPAAGGVTPSPSPSPGVTVSPSARPSANGSPAAA